MFENLTGDAIKGRYKRDNRVIVVIIVQGVLKMWHVKYRVLQKSLGI